MPKLQLLDNSSEDDSENELKINQSYASHYDVWRNKEELQKLKDLDKDISETSSESEEEEPKIEKDFLKTLSLLKQKDPRIYDDNVRFFTEEPKGKQEKKKKKEKPMFLKDYERELVLERQGKFSDDEEHIPFEGKTFKEEVDEVKKGFKTALEASDSEEEDDLLKVRSKTEEEQTKEEEDYLAWLKGKEKELKDDSEKEMLFLRKVWNDPNIDEGEKFLRDYILNQEFAEKEEENKIPTYDEITAGNLSDDEKDLKKQEWFEHKYNFRFEEPDEEFIRRYPRTVDDSLRRSSNKRKEKREEYTERKKREKEQKREELKRLKALKRKEIEDKFMKLKEVSGYEELNLNEEDIESDFDPEKHDRKMKELFNDDYYSVNEGKKPEFEFDEEIDDENWDDWTPEQAGSSKVNQNNVEIDECGESDEEVESSRNAKLELEEEMLDATRKGKKRGRKKSLFAKIVSQPKPLYDPEGKSFDEYLDEYYRLDCEDVIGDLPVRFKYRTVVPNDFGLTVEEILAADDKELNKWCSVKKTCQYRDENDEKYDLQAFRRKAQDPSLKQKVLASVYAPQENMEAEQKESSEKHKAKRKKKKKKASKVGMAFGDDAQTEEQDGVTSITTSISSKKKKKKQKVNIAKNEFVEESQPEELAISIEEEQESSTSNGVSKTKKRKKTNSLSTDGSVRCSPPFESATFETNEQGDGSGSDDVPKKKKKAKTSFASEKSAENNELEELTSLEKHEPAKETNSTTSISSKKKKKNKKNQNQADSQEATNSSQKAENSTKFLENGGNKRKNTFDNSGGNITKKHKHFHSSSEVDESSARNEWTPKGHQKSKKKKGFHFGQSGAQSSKFKDTDVQKKLSLSDSRLAAFGINPKKFKNSLIYRKK